MNIHPIFVHFPIALLTVYALMELLRFKKLTENVSWHLAKAGLVIIGTLAGIATIITGGMAEKIVGESKIIEIHSTFAITSIIIFLFISALYKVDIISRNLALGSFAARYERFALTRGVYHFFLTLKNFFFNSGAIVLPALVGLACITITGALGGAIVYGPDFDPFIHFIYKTLYFFMGAENVIN